MGMLNPALFAGAIACIAVPILIHLLMRRRRKPVRWAAMRFLVEAYKRNRKRLLIERWLLLALRCLALLLLAVALGRPALLAAGLDGPGTRTVYVLIDDSLSSTATDASGVSGVRRHAAAAREVIGSLDPMRGDRVGLISMSQPARGIVLAPSTDLAAVAGLLDSMEPTDARADVQGAVELVIDDIAAAQAELGLEDSTQGPVVVAVFSDWLEGTARGESALPDWPEQTGVEFLLSPPRADEPATVSITAVAPVRGVTSSDDVGGDRVAIYLARAGGSAAVSRVVLRGRTGPASWSPPLGEALVRWSPGQTTAQAMIAFDRSAIDASKVGRWGALRVEIDGDELPGDDVRYAAVQVRTSLRIGIAGPGGFDRPTSVRDYGPSEWVRLAMVPGGRETGIELRDVPTTSIERERLSDLSALFVLEPARVTPAGWTRLGEFVSRGGLLVVTPDADERGTPVWPDALSQTLGLGWSAGSASEMALTISPAPVGELLKLLEPELAEIAGSIPVRRRLELDAGEGETVLSLSDGTPMVVAGRGEATRGLVVLVASALDLEWMDLPARGLMVPLVQELVRQGIDAANPRAVSVAGREPAVPSGTQELRSPGRERITVESGEAARFAGVWDAIDAQGAAAGVAVVNPDADAGRARVRSTDEVLAWFESQTGRRPGVLGDEEASANGDGRASRTDAGWALPAIVLLLVALVAEALLARRFSHAELRPMTVKLGRGARA